MTKPRASDPPTQDRAHRRDRLWGLVIIATAFAGSLGLSAWSHRAVQPPSVDDPSGVTEGVVGWPNSIRVIRSLTAARRLVPWPYLRSIVASGVRGNGTIDVQNKGYARYTFEAPPQDPSDGEKPDAELVCPLQVVKLTAAGLVAEPPVLERPCPKPPPSPLPEPKCGLGHVWQFALNKGYAADNLADVRFYRSVSGPAWTFSLRRGRVSFSVDADCEKELSPDQARSR